MAPSRGPPTDYCGPGAAGGGAGPRGALCNTLRVPARGDAQQVLCGLPRPPGARRRQPTAPRPRRAARAAAASARRRWDVSVLGAGLLCAAHCAPPAAAVSSTATMTETISLTQTETLPTAEATLSATFTLPSETNSLTVSWTKTSTSSWTLALPTLTPSGSSTLTLPTATTVTETATLLVVHRYSTAMAPYFFYEGQDVRVKVTAVLDESPIPRFDTSRAGTVRFRVWAYRSDLGGGCAGYGETGFLWETREFGVSTAERQGGGTFVAAAHATFTAPPFPTRFIVCFLHQPDSPWADPTGSAGWRLILADGGDGGKRAVHQAAESTLRYEVPFASAGQYALVRLTGPEEGDFEPAAEPTGGCGKPGSWTAAGAGPCLGVDNLKLVPAGTPCTWEHQRQNESWTNTMYWGSAFVTNQGEWSADAAPGLFEGATAGGVALLLGTPDGGTAPPALTTAYASLRLPQTPGDYELCLSSVSLRMQLANFSDTDTNETEVDSAPMWRKVYPCAAGGPAPCNRATAAALQVAPEPLSWSAPDLTPRTWGTLRFQGGGGVPLNRAPVRVGAGDRWRVAGGDQFRLVPLAEFGEATHRNWSAQPAPYGSFPKAGCWSGGLDVPRAADGFGGWADSGAPSHASSPRPAGSRNLEGDPTNSSSSQDAAGVASAYATIWLPGAGEPMRVCYRAAAGGGWRVLPWRGGTAVADARWRTQSAAPTATQPSALVTAAPTGEAAAALDATPPVWLVNDTRAGTYGPVVVSIDSWGNSSTGATVDSRPWSYRGTYEAGQTVLSAVGSALRVVPSSYPCDWPGFAASGAAWSSDGGDIECSPEEVSNGGTCLGAAADHEEATAVAYHVAFPSAQGAYRVCWRRGGLNWRELLPHPDSIGAAPPSPLLAVSPPSLARLLSAELSAGTESFVVIADPTAGLSAGPGGDVVRVMPAQQGCDLRADTWSAGLTNAALGAYCGLGGLTTLPACSRTPWVRSMCGGRDCAAATASERAALQRYLNATPPSFADILAPDPPLFSLSQVVASVSIPATPGVLYKVCYKHAGMSNWVVWNETEPIVSYAPVAAARLAEAQGELLGGELRGFSLAVSAPVPARVYGRLVRAAAGASSAVGDSCAAPPAGTQAERFASAETAGPVASGPLRLSLVVPQQPGRYWLCVHARAPGVEQLAWFRYGPYAVRDSGVQWYVGGDDRPTNLAAVRVRLLRAPPYNTFNTNPGGDAAKLVALQSGGAREHCHDGAQGLIAAHGTSVHIGVGVDAGRGAAGHTNLGPADNNATTDASFVVGLPATAGDAPARYRVCVLSSFEVIPTRPPSERRVWVEVPEVPRPISALANVVVGGFTAVPARVARWELAPALSPGAADPRSPPDAAGEALAGASTRFVAEAPELAAADGLAVRWRAAIPTPQGSVANNWLHQFKLIRVHEYDSRASAWPGGFSAATCQSESEEMSSNVAPCPTGAGCPNVTVTGDAVALHLHIPLLPGGYVVCYRLRDSAAGWGAPPWLQLPAASGLFVLYSVSPALAFQAGEAPADAPLRTVTAFDYARWRPAAARGPALSRASWCSAAGGPDCSAGARGGIVHDLVTVVRRGELCPTPAAAPAGGAGWARLQPQTEDSAAVLEEDQSAGLFSLPPSPPSASKQYAVCLYKAGQYSAAAEGWVSRAGVVYQLLNDGPGVVTGRDTGLYFDVVAAGGGGDLRSSASKLTAQTSIVYNDSVTFMTMTQDMVLYYRSLPVDKMAAFFPYSEATGFSSSPFVEAAEGLAVEVRTETAAGEALPVGTIPMSVRRCPRSASWDDGTLFCSFGAVGRDAHALQVDEFRVANVGESCPAEFGVGTDGLTVASRAGSAHFDIRPRSCCPQSGGTMPNPGCGIKVTGRVPGTNTSIESQPLWFNVEPHFPETVDVDGHRVRARVPPTRAKDEDPGRCGPLQPLCFLKTCRNLATCRIELQARWRGETEYCARGGLSVLYSNADYGRTSAEADRSLLSQADFDAASWREEAGAAWQPGGAYVYSTRPALRAGRDAATIFFNITYGPPQALVWTRIAVRVERPRPARLLIADVVPLDIRGADREPTPVWHAARSAPRGFAAPSALLAAEPGSHLVALAPYEVWYQVTDAEGNAVSDLDGWMVTMGLREGVGRAAPQGNRVLQVERGPNGTASPDNLLSAPSYTLELSPAPPALRGELPTAHAAAGGPRQPYFAAGFRVLNSRGCSRLAAPAPGCLVRVALRKPGEGEVAASVRTPVRVPAAGVRVLLSRTASTVREGIEVTVLPGTPSPGGWLPDEFHYGEAFALLGLQDGLRTQDGAELRGAWNLSGAPLRRLPQWHPMRIVPLGQGETAWGARWLLRTDRPCVDCLTTFHTTWGAGPLSYTAAGEGSARLTWTDDTAALRCLACAADGGGCGEDLELPFYASSPHSQNFSVRAFPAASAGGNARWGEWAVRIDAAAVQRFSWAQGGRVAAETEPYREHELDVPGGLLRRMGHEGGETGVLFAGLAFRGAEAPQEDAALAIPLSAVGQRYSSELPGSVALGPAVMNCTLRLTLKRVEVTPDTDTTRRFIELVAVRGTPQPRPLNCSGGGCYAYAAVLGQEIEFEGRFMMQRPHDPAPIHDRADRNITITTREGESVSWVCSGPSSPCTSTPRTFPSPYASVLGRTDDPAAPPSTYSYGTGVFSFTRSKQQYTTAPTGRAFVRLRQAPTSEPVRRATFKLCPGRLACSPTERGCSRVGTEEGEIADEGQVPCLRVELYILPQERPALHAAIVSTANLALDGLLRPGAGGCGRLATRVGLGVLAYYPISINGAPGQFIAYDLALAYSLSAVPSAGQQLVPAGAPLLLNASLVYSNAVPAGLAPEARLLAEGDRGVSLEFYGLHAGASSVQFQVSAVDRDAGQPDPGPPALTARSYVFAAANETFDTFSVQPAVTEAHSCPERRYMAVERDGYVGYEAGAGREWRYADGLRVGVPAPFQVVVGTSSVVWAQGDDEGDDGDDAAQRVGCPPVDPDAPQNASASLEQCKLLCEQDPLCLAVSHKGALCRMERAPARALDGDAGCSHWRALRNRRAWGSPRAMLTVRVGLPRCCGSGACQCCGTGGDSIDVYTMRPEAAGVPGQQAVPGNVSALELRSAGCRNAHCFAGYVEQGAHTVWVRFSEPCQSCELEFRLCDPSAGPSAAAECLLGLPPGAAPPLALRTARARFPVRPAAPDRLLVEAQALPEAGAGGAVQVGAEARLVLKTVQTFGGRRWAMDAVDDVDAQVWAVSTWAPADDSQQYYGNGGFIGQILPRAGATPCGVPAAAVRSAHRFQATARTNRPATAGARAELRVYFTRPCSRCEVWLHWSVAPSGGAGPSGGHFPVRPYSAPAGGTYSPADEPARFRVRSCPAQWTLAPAPPSVRRHRPFSVGVLLADRNMLPVWEGNRSVALTPLRRESYGNGGGGDLVVTSPTLGGTGELWAVGGAATARAHYTRACWRCAFAVGGVRHSVAVLTDPSLIAAMAATADLSPSYGAPAAFDFQVYAADELFDRSYVVGGPSLLQWQPLHGQGPVESSRVTIRDAALVSVEVGDATVVLSGGPVVRVANGTFVVNGIPYGRVSGDQGQDSGPGLVSVSVSARPGVDVPIEFAMTGVDASVPTREFGGTRAPSVDWGVAPDRIAVSAQWGAGEAPTVLPGGEVRLSVYAVAPADSGELAGRFYRSVRAVDGAVSLAADCSACTGCVLSGPRDEGGGGDFAARFVRGVAEISLRFRSGSGSCQLTLASPAALPAPPVSSMLCSPRNCSFRVTVAPIVYTRWVWDGTGSFQPTVSAADWAESDASLLSPRARGLALGGEAVTLALRAWDEGLTAESQASEPPWDDWDAGALRVNMRPAGCFLVSSPSRRGNRILIAGHFLRGVETCVLGPTEGDPVGVEGLPEGRATQALHVAIQRVSGAALAEGGLAGLTARAPSGAPAALAGRGAALHVRTNTEDGELCGADFASVAVGLARRGARQVVVSAAVRAGRAVLEFPLRQSTAESEGGAEEGNDTAPPAAPPHMPWEVTAAVALPQAPVRVGGTVLLHRGWGPCGAAGAASAADLLSGRGLVHRAEPYVSAPSVPCAALAATPPRAAAAAASAPPAPPEWSIGVVLNISGDSAWVGFPDANRSAVQGCLARLAPVQELPPLGPLYVVVQAEDVVVQMQVAGGRWQAVRGSVTAAAAETGTAGTAALPAALPATTPAPSAGQGQSRRARAEQTDEPPPPVGWTPAMPLGVAGAPLSLCVTAVDRATPPNVPQEGEAGSAVEFVFRAFAVPCRSADMDIQWLRSTCIPNGACSAAPLPSCSGRDWLLVEGNSTAPLEGRLLGLREGSFGAQVVYTGAGGPARFALTTDDFGRSEAAPSGTGREMTFLSAMLYFQVIHALAVAGAAGGCRPAGGAHKRVCGPPTGPFYNASQHRLRTRLYEGRPELLALPRVDPGVPLSIAVRVVDPGGSVVRADNDTVLRLAASCPDSRAPGDRLLLSGRPQRRVSAGVALFDDLVLFGRCTRAVLSVTCVSNALLSDTLCRALETNTSAFEVGESLALGVTPVPDTVGGNVPVVRLLIASGTAAAALLADALRTKRALERAMLDSLSETLEGQVADCFVERLCLLPKSAAGVIGDFADDPNFCTRYYMGTTPAPVPSQERAASALQIRGCTTCDAVGEVAVIPRTVLYQVSVDDAVAAALGTPTSPLMIAFPAARISKPAPPTASPSAADASTTTGGTTGTTGTTGDGATPRPAGAPVEASIDSPAPRAAPALLAALPAALALLGAC
eukprot:TRINITY_DN3058_c0_g1_i2.p1 TRINITY_DN3058_c0_g1~~TRINITY_DN3058_c0_g1_i2.p1  ORF type:complete len:4805 (+),score=1267.70 TRINITY_DN3058_c0_g1_i2:103-14415(+)